MRSFVKSAGGAGAGLMLAVLLALVWIIPVSARTALVDDGAALLSAGEISSLETKVSEASRVTGFDLMLVTTGDAGGRSAENYAENYYLEHAETDDGAVCLIDMDNREIYIATSGQAIRYLTDARMNRILDKAYDRISSQDYAGTLSVMLDGITDAYRQGIPSGQMNYNVDTQETDIYREPNAVTPFEALFSAVAALIAGSGLFGAVNGRYKMKTGKYSYDLAKNSGMQLTVQTNRLVNRFVTRRHIPRVENTSHGGSGGGHISSTHVGSGGHTFGGGGRKF